MLYTKEFTGTESSDPLEQILAACYRIARERARQLKIETAFAEPCLGEPANAVVTTSAGNCEESPTLAPVYCTPKARFRQAGKRATRGASRKARGAQHAVAIHR